MWLILEHHAEVEDWRDLGYLEPYHDKLHTHAILSYESVIKSSQTQDKVGSRDCLNSKYWAYTDVRLKNNRKLKTKNFNNLNQLIHNCIPRQQYQNIMLPKLHLLKSTTWSLSNIEPKKGWGPTPSGNRKNNSRTCWCSQKVQKVNGGIS